MDVPRRLRSGRLSGLAQRQCENSTRDAGNPVAAAALVAIIVVQFPTRHAAIFYCVGATLSFGFLYFGLEFVLQRSRAAARRLLAASIVYLPLLFVLRATLRNSGRS